LNQLIFDDTADTAITISPSTATGQYRQLNFRANGAIDPSITVQSGSIGDLAIGTGSGAVWLNANLTVTHNGAGTLSIGSPVIGASGAGIVKDGTGTLVLSGANTYSGESTVNGGVLAVTGSGKLGSGDVTVTSGVLSNTVSTAIANTAILTIADGAAVYLSSGINEAVYRLQLGSNFASIGTWGTTGSGADYIDDTHFAGTGKVNVLDAPPPPAGTVLIIK
jgi:autotransporter-associated beta strand protein